MKDPNDTVTVDLVGEAPRRGRPPKYANAAEREHARRKQLRHAQADFRAKDSAWIREVTRVQAKLADMAESVKRTAALNAKSSPELAQLMREWARELGTVSTRLNKRLSDSK